MQAASRQLSQDLLAADDSLVPVESAEGPVVARRTGHVSSYPELMRQNLDLVIEAAEAAGVVAAVLDTSGAGRYVVVVRASERAALLTELAERWGGEAVYVRPAPTARVPAALAELVARESEPVAGKVAKLGPVLAGAVQPADWPEALESPVLQIYRCWTGPAGRTVISTAAACEVEFWFEVPTSPGGDPGPVIVPTRSNRRISELHRWTVEPAARSIGDVTYPALAGCDRPLDMDVQFPIDLVYTWVDGADPEHRARRDRYLALENRQGVHESAIAEARWRDRDELRYALRSVEQNAGWIRTIWIVTEDQVPSWLDTSNPRVKVVSSRDIFVNQGLLPTFNSHAVEAQLHHIDGLAEHYLYSNDDYFFGRPVRAEQFFAANGLARIFRATSKIDVGPPRPEDRPIIAAHKNHRAIFERDFGVTITYRLKHAVAAQRRSVMYEIEERYPDEFARTVGARFRSPGDLSFASTFGPYYLMLTGRGFSSALTYGYAESALARLEQTLTTWLAKRDVDVFCINDTGLATEQIPAVEQHRVISEFLAEYFPWPSSFERSEAPSEPGDLILSKGSVAT